MTKAREIAELGQKLTVDGSGNLDIAGSGTFDGLTVTGTIGNWSIDSQGVIQSFTRPSTSYIKASDASGNLMIQTGGSNNRALFASNGDIGFYDDSNTAKLFWDASAESLKLGSTSTVFTDPNIDIEAGTASGRQAGIWLRSNSGNSVNQINVNNNILEFGNGGTTDSDPTMSVVSTGKVYINRTTALSNSALSISSGSTDGVALALRSTGGTEYGLYITPKSDGTITQNATGAAAGTHVFSTAGTERFRIKSGVEAVFNDNSNNYDFRVESNNKTHMLFVDAGNNSVSINDTGGNNDAVFVVKADSVFHPAIKIGSPNANGYTLLADDYLADESVLNIGLGYSGGNPTFSRSVKPSTTAESAWVSSQDTFAAKPAAFEIKNDGFHFYHTRTSATTTTDSAVTLTSFLDISGDGIVANNAGTADADFRVESDSRTDMFFVDAGNNTVNINNSAAYANNTFLVNQTADARGIALAHTGRGNSRVELQLAGVGNEGATFYHNNHTDRKQILHFSRSNFVVNEESLNMDFRVESDNRANMLFVDAGNDYVGVGSAASGATSLYVHGGVTKSSANQDPKLAANITNGSHYGNQNGGSIEAVYGWSGTGRSGSKFIIEYAANTWKAYAFEIQISSTRGMARIFVGGYNNSSDQNTTYIDDDSNMITSVVHSRTSTIGAGQGNKVTITMSGTDVHPMMTVKYSQTGGDSTPRGDRLHVETVY